MEWGNHSNTVHLKKCKRLLAQTKAPEKLGTGVLFEARMLT